MARLILLCVIAAVVLALVVAWVIASRRWRVTCEEHGDRTEVWLRRGSHAHFIGAADRMRDDYSDAIIALQSQGQDKRDELNSMARLLKS